MIAPRSRPLQDELEHLRPNWGQLDGMQVPLDFGDPSGELAAAARLGLSDVSALAKLVVKGPGAEAFLQREQIEIPAEIFQVCRWPRAASSPAPAGPSSFSKTSAAARWFPAWTVC